MTELQRQNNPNGVCELTLHYKADAGLPAGWEVRHSNSKNLPYYFNSAQQLSRWEPPPGTNTDKLKAYMATNHSAQEIRPETSAVNGNEGKIRASHLLIKHKDSRRPSSWREVSCRFVWRPRYALSWANSAFHRLRSRELKTRL